MYIILIVILIVIFIIYKIYAYTEIHYQKGIDGKTYAIRLTNKSEQFYQESANQLAEINKRIEQLIKHLDEKFKNDDSKNYFIKKLKESYSHDILSEASIDSRYTTFTIDKSEMHICLRSRDSHEKMYNINTLMYVVLHELGHLCNYNKQGNPIMGHGIEFKRIFKFLTEEAIKINIYEDQEFDNKPSEYCNIIINSSIV
jgi:hypothetical protein